jgi:hypothetical protein
MHVSATQASKKTHASYYDHRPHQLLVAFFDDDAWAQYQKLLKEGSLCRDRIAQATHRNPIRAERGKSSVRGEAFNFRSNLGASINTYVVLTDCWLEEYSAHPPSLDYTLTFTNGGSHLPAEEDGMISLFWGAFIALAALTVVWGRLLLASYARFSQHHLLALLIGAALLSQLVAVPLQLAHLHVYQVDGMGLKLRHTWFAADFLSEMSQLFSELVVAFILICLALGWTLTDRFRMTRVLTRTSAAAFAAIALLHLWLQYRGRQFSEDFTFFHDHSHWPGLLLLLLRLAMLAGFMICMYASHGIVPGWVRRSKPIMKILVAAGAVTRGSDGEVRVDQPASTDGATAELLQGLMVVGMIWFACFPASVILTLILPFALRKLVIVALALVVHTSTIAVLMWNAMRPESGYFSNSSLKHLGSVFGSGDRLGKTALD